MRKDMDNLINQNGMLRAAYDTNQYFRKFINKLSEDDDLRYNEDLVLKCHYIAGLMDGVMVNDIDINYFVSIFSPKNTNKIMYTTSTVNVESIINHRSKLVQKLQHELYDVLFSKVFEAWCTDKNKFPARDYIDAWVWDRYGIFVNTDNSTYNTETNKTAPFGSMEQHLKIVNLATVEQFQEEYLAGENDEFYNTVFRYAKLVADDFISKYDIWFDDPEIMITKHGAAIQNAIKNTFGIDCDLVIGNEDNSNYMHITTIAPYRTLMPYEKKEEKEEETENG